MDIFLRISLEALNDKKRIVDILPKESLMILNNFNGAIKLDILLHVPVNYSISCLTLVSKIFNLFYRDEIIAKTNIYYGGTMGCVDLIISEVGDYKPFPIFQKNHYSFCTEDKPKSNQSLNKLDKEATDITKHQGNIIISKIRPPYEAYFEFSTKKDGAPSFNSKMPDIDHCLKHEFNQYGIEIGVYAIHAQKIFSDDDYIDIRFHSINDKTYMLRNYLRNIRGIKANINISETKARQLIEKFNQYSLTFNIKDYKFSSLM